MDKPVRNRYSDEVCEEMAFMFLYDQSASLVSIARHYGVLDGGGRPNNSYARQLIHRFLRKHSSRAWFQVDGIEAENDKVTPSREALSDMIVAFFPDLGRYRELLIKALEFKMAVIAHNRQRQIARDGNSIDTLVVSLKRLTRPDGCLTEEELLQM